MDGYGLCQCGCGQPAPIAKRTVTSRGRFKGQPLRFIHGHNTRGMDRSKPVKTDRYRVEDRGYETPCWIWLLNKSQVGYGKVRVKGKDLLAHRVSYEEHVGPIPEGLQLDHLCSQRDCVNPEHLEPVTALENTRRNRGTKLTVEEAQRIEWLSRRGTHSDREIAELFCVSRQTVALIRQNGADGPRLPSRREPGTTD